MNPDVPLPWTLRGDLQLVAGEGGTWVVKDPLRLKYFRIQAEEMGLLRQLDGRSTWGEILNRWQKEFRYQRFSEANLAAFLTSMINSALLTSSQPGQGRLLANLGAKARSAARLQQLMAAFAYRWKGIDPTGLLRVTDRAFGWVFSPLAMCLVTAFVLATAATVLVRLPTIEAELPRFSELATIGNLPYLILAFVVIKIFHELGHGTACRRYGGECHELGVLFIGVFPLMYCDVSDAWLFRERWKRVLVSAAGIYVELFVAAVAAWLWMMSVPGVLHTFFLNIAIVASVNTLLINGNPLLRYDGYYVIADGLGVANLGAEARRAAASVFDRLVLGISRERVGSSALGEIGLIAFGTASACYRLFVVGLILWVLYEMLEPYGLDFVVVLMAAGTAAGMGVSSMRAVSARAKQTAGPAGGRMRAFVGMGALLCLTAAGLLVPLPKTVSAGIVLMPGESRPVYVTAAGRLESIVEAGQYVEAGDVVAKLHDETLLAALVRAEGDLSARQEHLRQLLNRRADDPDVARGLPTAKEAVAAAEAVLDTIQQRMNELTVRAETDGYVMPPRRGLGEDLRPRTPAVTPLDRLSIGAFLPEQTLVCWIGDVESLRIVAAVDEVSVPQIQNEYSGTVRFASNPLAAVPVTVSRVSSKPTSDVPLELQITGAVAVGRQAGRTLADEMYRVELRLTDATAGEADWRLVVPAPLYSTGTVDIHCPPESLASRAWRLFCHTFAIQLR